MLSMRFLFSAKGRITRSQYWLSFLLYFVLIIALVIAMAVLGLGGSGYSDYMARAQAAKEASQLEGANVLAGDEPTESNAEEDATVDQDIVASTESAAAGSEPMTSSDGSLAATDVMESTESTGPVESGETTSESSDGSDATAVTAGEVVGSEEALSETAEPMSLDETDVVASAPAAAGVGGLVLTVLGFVLSLALLYSSLVVQIKRWHDQNLTGWLVLINLTGIGTLATFIMCGFLRGTLGPNKYGADPRAPASTTTTS